jgi:2-keto-4-pentenoate hydratase/2-oxohepta-3-ene-1,7-dioic acid hydratase in catechol pathway
MTQVVRHVRVRVPSGERWARVEGAEVVLLDGAPWSGGRETKEQLKLADASLACPIAPRAIYGIGRNYRAHAAEMKGEVPREPLVFAKGPSSVLAHEGTVLLPKESEHVDYEAELGVVIGASCRRVSVERALEHVFGYVVLCDVTARDLQKNDGQWTRAKGFDTFCPVGPAVVSGIEPGNLSIVLKQNGELRQNGNTADMVFDVARLVSHVSGFTTLTPGDLIATGTPEGVGPLAPGDRVEISISQVGDLVFHVAREG